MIIRFKRLVKSFGYAGRGLVKIFKEEQNFQIESVATLLVIVAALVIGVTRTDLAILVFTCALVLIMEVINSAVEAISDVLKPKLDTYVKRIKDIVAAGVMLAALTAIIVGCLIFGQYFF